jgi:hypothetical protein
MNAIPLNRGLVKSGATERLSLASGGGGIRTHEAAGRGLPVFKTGAFNRSATPPGSSVVPNCGQF